MKTTLKTRIKIMTLCVFVLSFVSCISLKKSNMDFVETAEIKNKTDFASVSIPTFMVKPILVRSLKRDGEDKGTINLVKGIKKAKILTIDNASENVLKGFQQYNQVNGIQELLSVNSHDDKVKIYGKETEGGFNRLILAINSKTNRELTFIDVKGKFTEKMVLDLNIN